MIIDEGHDIIKKIIQMNKEISNELTSQNAFLDNLDSGMNQARTNVIKNDTKLDKIAKKTSSTYLIIGMIVQTLIIIFLIFI